MDSVDRINLEASQDRDLRIDIFPRDVYAEEDALEQVAMLTCFSAFNLLARSAFCFCSIYLIDLIVSISPEEKKGQSPRLHLTLGIYG